MSNFSSLNVLKSACTDEWVAKTYSEYLMTCAQDKTALMDKITEISIDEDLESLADETIAECEPLCEYVDNAVFDEIPDTVDKSKLSRSSTQFRVYFALLLTNDEEFPLKVQEMQTILGFDPEQQTALEFFDNYYAEHTLDEIVCLSPVYKDALDDKVSNALSELKYNENTTYTLNSGFVKLSDLIKAVVTHTESLDGTFSIDAYDSQDNSIGALDFSVDEFWNESKANLVSTLAWAEGFAVVGVSNISDRINSFDAAIKSMVTDVGASFAASISNVKSRIGAASITVRDFIEQAGEQLGWTKLKDEQAVVDDTDITSYTGASPLSDLNLNTAKGVLTATARTVVAVGYGLWMAVKSLAKKCWGKIRPYVMAITNNPYDIAKISNSDSYTIDGWCLNSTSTYDFLAQDIYDTSGSNLQNYVDNVNRYIDAVNKNVGKWLKIETIFGEALIKFNSITPSEHINVLSSLTWISINCTTQFKPRCMNYKTIGSYIGTLSDAALGVMPYKYISATHNWATVDFTTMSEDIQSFYKSGDMYLDTDSSEAELQMGFMLGIDCFLRTLDLSYKEMCVQLNSGSNCYFRHTHWSGNTHPTDSDDLLSLHSLAENVLNLSSRTVTNRNFMQAAAGFYDHNTPSTPADWTFDQTYYWTYASQTGVFSMQRLFTNHNVSYWHGYIIPLLILNLLEIFKDKIMNPLDHVYFPYSSDQTDFQDPRFKIKTDAENKNVASMFYNILAVVALVIITVAVVGCVAKIAKNAAQSRARFKVGQLDSKIWKGKKLTPLENWTYRRKTKKLSKLSAASSGLNSSSSAVESIQKIYDTVSANQNGAIINNTLYDPEGNPASVSNDSTEWSRYANVYKAITGLDLSFN